MRFSLLLLAGVALALMATGDAEKEPEWSYSTGGSVYSVATSADGEYIVVGSDSGKVYFFDKDGSTPLWSYGADGRVISVAISADGAYIAAGTYDGNVYLFNNNVSQNGGDGNDGGDDDGNDGGGDAVEAVCQHGDTKLADDGFNHCICNDGEWLCTDMEYDEKDDDSNVTVTPAEEGEEGIPAPSLAAAVAAVAVIALRRRR